MSLEAQKAFRKIDQIFKDRRQFAAHLFFMPSHKYWHLIYFDQRDTESKGNHWKIGGTHVHYSRESFCQQSMKVMWQNICSNPPKPPNSLHIRYKNEKKLSSTIKKPLSRFFYCSKSTLTPPLPNYHTPKPNSPYPQTRRN